MNNEFIVIDMELSHNEYVLNINDTDVEYKDGLCDWNDHHLITGIPVLNVGRSSVNIMYACSKDELVESLYYVLGIMYGSVMSNNELDLEISFYDLNKEVHDTIKRIKKGR